MLMKYQVTIKNIECAMIDNHQQCDVNCREIRRATVWSYALHRRIDGLMPSPEGMRPSISHIYVCIYIYIYIYIYMCIFMCMYTSHTSNPNMQTLNPTPKIRGEISLFGDIR